MAEARKPATIIDVAQAAGVAVGTVSRYINGLPIRSGNRERIAQVIEELGYRRNDAAASIKTNTTNIVGLLVPAVSEFHAALLDQLTRRMRQAGRAVLCFCHDAEPATILEGLEFFASRRVDAVVMDGNEDLRQQLGPYIEEGMLIVLYDNDLPGVAVDRVFVDNRLASKRLVDHLLDLGHERVATIHGNLRDSVGRDRLEGYRDALAARGLTEHPELVINGRWGPQGGYSGMRDLMALDNPPTAVFGANYNMTIGLLQWLMEHDVAVPEDISVVSFDDVPAFTVHRPGITAVGQPVDQIAANIVDILNERIGTPDTMGRRMVQINADITLRGSTRPPRR